MTEEEEDAEWEANNAANTAYNPPDCWIYQADVYCEKCTRAIKRRLRREGAVPAHPEDEATYDSDEWPKGPYSDEEADTPQHCGSGGKCLDPTVIQLPAGGTITCGRFFENPLTEAGEAYVREKLQDTKGSVAELLWGPHYGITADEPLPTEPDEEDLVTDDYRRWWEHGSAHKIVIQEKLGEPHEDVDPETGEPVSGPEGSPAVERWVYLVKRYMDHEQHWPNAWFQGERGDWNLLDLESGGYAAERKV
jgi:hypothetical protein